MCRPCPNNGEVVVGREAPDAEVVATSEVMVTFIGRRGPLSARAELGGGRGSPPKLFAEPYT